MRRHACASTAMSRAAPSSTPTSPKVKNSSPLGSEGGCSVPWVAMTTVPGLLFNSSHGKFVADDLVWLYGGWSPTTATRRIHAPVSAGLAIRHQLGDRRTNGRARSRQVLGRAARNSRNRSERSHVGLASASTLRWNALDRFPFGAAEREGRSVASSSIEKGRRNAATTGFDGLLHWTALKTAVGDALTTRRAPAVPVFGSRDRDHRPRYVELAARP